MADSPDQAENVDSAESAATGETAETTERAGSESPTLENPAIRGVLLQVAYRGAPFSGYAIQKDARTVEGELRGAIAALDPAASTTRGVSRTDAGVHAEAQQVAFDTVLPIPARGWVLALNKHLPEEIAVRRARPVSAGFNPRFASQWKRYRYRILLDKVRDPAHAARTWRVGWDVAFDLARAECEVVLGTHDFAAFRSAGDERENTVRDIRSLDIGTDAHDPRLVSVAIEGSAFMYNMVRIVVGTLVDVARGHLPPGAFARALASKDRRDLGQTAPPEGLCLEHVELTLPEGAGEPWPG